MPDIQNFFHKALAVIFAKVHLYFKRKLSVSSFKWYHFPVAHAMCAEVTFVLIFSHTTSIEQKCRVSDQLSDGLIFGRLFQANERISAFRSCVTL